MFIVDYATYVFLGRFFWSLGQEKSIFLSEFGPVGRSARHDHCFGQENLPLSRFGPSWPQFRPTGHELVTGRAELLKNLKIKVMYCGLDLVTWRADLPKFFFLSSLGPSYLHFGQENLFTWAEFFVNYIS